MLLRTVLVLVSGFSSRSLSEWYTVPATGEAFSPHNWTSSTSKHDISSPFSIFMGHSCSPWSLIRMRPSVDPDLVDKNQCGTGLSTLLYIFHQMANDTFFKFSFFKCFWMTKDAGVLGCGAGQHGGFDTFSKFLSINVSEWPRILVS